MTTHAQSTEYPKILEKRVPSCLGSDVPGPSPLKLKIKSVDLLHLEKKREKILIYNTTVNSTY